MAISYEVPGIKTVTAQDGPDTCWATVYTIMKTWKTGFQMEVRDTVRQVDPKYAAFYDAGLRSNPEPRGLPVSEIIPFLRAAGMRHQPMANMQVSGWLDLLQKYGLLWIGGLNEASPFGVLHSRIVDGINGEGAKNNTFFSIIDPNGGKRYRERFDTFSAKYEGALDLLSGEYYQIRHFPA